MRDSRSRHPHKTARLYLESGEKQEVAFCPPKGYFLPAQRLPFTSLKATFSNVKKSLSQRALHQRVAKGSYQRGSTSCGKSIKGRRCHATDEKTSLSLRNVEIEEGVAGCDRDVLLARLRAGVGSDGDT